MIDFYLTIVNRNGYPLADVLCSSIACTVKPALTHDITEILLKVALNTTIHPKPVLKGTSILQITDYKGQSHFSH